MAPSKNNATGAGVGKSGSSAKAPRRLKSSSSSKAGLNFPVGRITRMLRSGHYTKRMSKGAPIVLAAVLEYLTAEVIDCAGHVARAEKKTRISPRHIMLAIRRDQELDEISKGVTVAQGGAVPYIQEALLPDNHPAKPKKRADNHPAKPKKGADNHSAKPKKGAPKPEHH